MVANFSIKVHGHWSRTFETFGGANQLKKKIITDVWQSKDKYKILLHKKRSKKKGKRYGSRFSVELCRLCGFGHYRAIAYAFTGRHINYIDGLY